MRKPDIICIGVQKSGTTWFHYNMSSRPDIWVPPFKEVHFFDYKFVPEYRRWIIRHVERGVRKALSNHNNSSSEFNSNYVEYLASIMEKPMFNGRWYKRIFAPAPSNMLCLDVTPEYSTLPIEGVNFVAEFSRNAKFLLFLREPVARAISQIKMNLTRQNYWPKNEDGWLQLVDDPLVLRRSSYLDIVPRWERALAPDQLLVLSYDLLQNDPKSFLRETEKFLGISKGKYPKLTQRIHHGSACEIPDFAKRKLEEQLKPHVDFFKERFR